MRSPVLARRPLRALLLPLAVCASFGCGNAESESESPIVDDGELIDGQLAAKGELGGVVRLDQGCTATLVGPRLVLTASHCIRTEAGAVGGGYAAGRTIAISVRKADNTLTEVDVKIVSAKVHPRITEICSKSPCSGGAADAKRDAPDLAVIKIDRDLPGVTVMPIDLRPTFNGEKLRAAGFGCTDGAFSRKGDDDKLRLGDTKVVRPEVVAHRMSPVNLEEATDLANVYVYTAGPALGTDAAGLCPGDSGGPLVRRNADGTGTLVGVNASYTFAYANGDPGRPMTNWHARVDLAARHGVLDWLKAQGAKVIP